jgi:hypothetical protein
VPNQPECEVVGSKSRHEGLSPSLECLDMAQALGHSRFAVLGGQSGASRVKEQWFPVSMCARSQI